VVARGDASAGSESAASMLEVPIVATTATGTVVVPQTPATR
jgi:3-aminobutyryl-CoA ammonia-lyase